MEILVTSLELLFSVKVNIVMKAGKPLSGRSPLRLQIIRVHRFTNDSDYVMTITMLAYRTVESFSQRSLSIQFTNWKSYCIALPFGVSHEATNEIYNSLVRPVSSMETTHHTFQVTNQLITNHPYPTYYTYRAGAIVQYSPSDPQQ